MEVLQKKNLYKMYLSWRLSVFLILCFCLGGTSQEIFDYKIIIYFLSVVIIAFTFLEKHERSYIEVSRVIYVFFFLTLFLFFIYLVPLPPSIWSELEGRGSIVAPYALAGIDALPWRSISLAPERAVKALMALLPAATILSILARSASQAEIKNSKKTTLFVGSISVIIGFFQFISNSTALYLYGITNLGSAVGLFSNSNHQACFLAMVLGCAITGFARRIAKHGSKGYLAPEYIVAICLTVIGLVMTRSLSGFILLAWAALFNIYFILQTRLVPVHPIVKKLIGTFGLFIILAAAIAAIGYVAHNLTSGEIHSQGSRFSILQKSLLIHDTFGFWGAGPGAFEQVYKLFEDRQLVSNIFVPEAHDDYLQIWLEFGWLGLGLAIAAVLWFVSQVVKLLRNVKTGHLGQWGFLVIASVPLVHSFWDYPLRTEALSAFFVYAIILGTKRSAY